MAEFQDMRGEIESMTVAAYDHPDSTNYLKKNNFERRN
jgi:hypothetical protein